MTALGYLKSYEKFWLPWDEDGTYVVYPSLNPTGTDTLRFVSYNPNEQQISKKEDANLRYCFGPAPGREWWSLDAKNIELRLPAYESGEDLLISLFEEPDKPPYYGSMHLLNFSTVYPDIWAKELKAVGLEAVGPHCKRKYADTWYQWCKNGGFAVQYGAVEKPGKEGTADMAFHRLGSHSKLKSRFERLSVLNKHWIQYANKHGYVETIPDKTVDPERGYPLWCTYNKYGTAVAPTLPLNYHVQGSAMWWMMKAMTRCQEFLDDYNRGDGENAYLVMQIHDEMLFDFPAAPRKGNLKYIQEIGSIMEKGGDDYGIPTPVSMEQHPVCWSQSA